MLDIQFIRDNPDTVTLKSNQKGYKVNVHELLDLDKERRQLLSQVEEIRARRNEISTAVKSARPTEEQISKGRELKDKLAKLETELKPIDEDYQRHLKSIPNMPLDDVPIGAREEDNVVAKRVGESIDYDFKPKQHWEIAEPRDLIDKTRAAKISGSRFAYIKGDLVRLQFAIIQMVLETVGDENVIEKLIRDNNLNLTAKPFTPVIPPAMLRTEPYEASARLNASEVTYKIEQDDLWLNASAEHTLCTMYWNEILTESSLPIRYIGYSTSFRREAGTYGKDTEGIFRLHQFDKLEMEVFSTPETGLDEHYLLVAIQEHLVQKLGLPYQVLHKSTFDIGKPNARGIDIECWFPGQGRYRETHTADFITDYQSRDLKIRLKRNAYDKDRITLNGEDQGKTEFVHTNDATAFALGRILAAIVENYQTKDGRIIIPEVLKPYMNGKTEI